MGSKTVNNLKLIGLLANPQKDIAAEFVKKIISFLADRKIPCVVSDDDIARAAGYPDLFLPEEHFAGKIDMLISLGGDGTMLRSARCVGHAGIPIFGINLGGLGFMTASSRATYLDDLQKLLNGEFCIEERMALECAITGHRQKYVVLNDVVVSRESISRVIDLEVTIDNDYLTTYTADGIIIATPTGSTAHSLSAGGPIISPNTEVVLLTPICPHTLTNRPLIINKDSKIKISLNSSQGQGLITIDGQNVFHIHEDDAVTVSCAPYTIKLMSVGSKSYFEILRQKLKWGGER